MLVRRYRDNTYPSTSNTDIAIEEADLKDAVSLLVEDELDESNTSTDAVKIILVETLHQYCTCLKCGVKVQDTSAQEYDENYCECPKCELLQPLEETKECYLPK